MENAAKGLIMAGGILIGIIVLSIGAFLYARMSNVKVQYDKDIEVAELSKFNTEFTVFEGRDDIRSYEIVSLNNFVNAYNDKPKNANKQITLEVYKKNGTSKIDVDNNFLRNNSTTKDNNNKTIIKYFTCTSLSDDSNGRVSKIVFKEFN